MSENDLKKKMEQHIIESLNENYVPRGKRVEANFKPRKVKKVKVKKVKSEGESRNNSGVKIQIPRGSKGTSNGTKVIKPTTRKG